LHHLANQQVIKKAYHKAVLMYHPDKAQYKTSTGKEDRTVFLKIQEAFSTLSNETKRRAYDSQLPFDESIPTEAKVQERLAKGPTRFMKLFDPVFKRNARFGVKKPVPELGDMDTPM
jgi:DnaJ family protein C protein 2